MGVVWQRVRVVVAGVSLVAGVSVSAAPPALAGVTINVPGSRPTIQAGIDAASNGDTVLVAPGTYYEHVDFKGKAIEVRSSAGPRDTIIDGGGTSSVVLFRTGEGRASVLRGFTITRGDLPDDDQPGLVAGAGIRVIGASPTITENIVTGNQAGMEDRGGGGIGVVGGSPLVRDNYIYDNRAAAGGGIFVADGGAEIVGNVVEGNIASGGGGIRVMRGTPIVGDNVVRANTGTFGGGLRVSSGYFLNNLIVENQAQNGGGVQWGREGASPPPTFLNNTIVGNASEGASAVLEFDGGASWVNNVIAGPPGQLIVCFPSTPPAVFTHNNVYDGTASPYDDCVDRTGTDGNVSVEPGFAPGSYNPQPGSPVIDAGDDIALSLPATDVYGQPRVTDGDGDGVATVDMGAVESATAVAPSGHRYHPLTPARLLDTRVGQGAPVAKLGPGATIDLQITGRGGLPAGGVDSVVLNVAVTNPTAPSWLTAWPAGSPFPLAANLNFVPAQTVANLVVVKVGEGGRVSLFNNAGATDVVADVAGWYGGLGGGSGYFPLTPARILDTRYGLGAPTARLVGGASLALQVTGQGGVPPSGVTAVVLNLTVTNSTTGGYLTAWPAGRPQPHTSSLNYAAGQTVPNLVVVKLGDGGRVDLFNSAGSADLVADVEGWFGADGAPGGAVFHSVVPARILDTREGRNGNMLAPPAPLAPDATFQLNATGWAGIPFSGVSAVVLNVTVTGPASEGYLTVWPSSQDRPLASNLNFVAGQTVPNLVVVPTNGNTTVYIYSSGGPVDVVADVAGWY